MNPIIFSVIFFVVGIIISLVFFNIKNKKTVSDFADKLRNFIASISPSYKEVLASIPTTSGNFGDLELIIEKVSDVKNIPQEKVSDENSSNEKEKSEKIKKLYDNLQVVNELGQHVTASLSLEDVFKHLYKTINSMMDAAVFELGVYHWKDNRWQILSNLELSDTQDNPSGSYKNHMAEWCLKNNREILLDDAENEFSRYVFEPLKFPDGKIAQSIIAFPIYQNEKERGSISVISFRKNAFNNYHIDMIRSLIPYVAVALDNALVHQELIITQNQLIHNEKMASIGQLSSGIAHEILNPLNFVNNFSELSIELFNEFQKALDTQDQVNLKDQLVNNLDKINFHGNRAYNIVKNMMQLTRSGDGEKSNVYVNKQIEDTINIAYEGFKLKYKGFECRIETVFDNNIPVKKMVAEDFTRVLINLFSNAFYAMNEKIKKLKQANNKELIDVYDPEMIVKTILFNNKIQITVRDNGTGVPDEIKEKIFLPFFTTKPTGEGTGLGLSLSHDIITKGNNGIISVTSDPGKWAEFKVEIPVN